MWLCMAKNHITASRYCPNTHLKRSNATPRRRECDEQARYIEAVISTDNGPVRFASIYLPNGNPVEDGNGPKYAYKLAWMERLYTHAKHLLSFEEPLILAGDYNVIPTDNDVFDAAASGRATPSSALTDTRCLSQAFIFGPHQCL